MEKQDFTRAEVIDIIHRLLECPDALMDAIQNEHTDHDAESLLQMVEGADAKEYF